jgi:hypothetical protein
VFARDFSGRKCYCILDFCVQAVADGWEILSQSQMLRLLLAELDHLRAIFGIFAIIFVVMSCVSIAEL